MVKNSGRSSDKIKAPFSGSHDSQITGTLHDEILMWLYDTLSRDISLVSKITGVEQKVIVDVKKEIESPIMGAAYNGQVVAGFADLKVIARSKYFYTDKEIKEAQSRSEQEWVEIMKKNKFEWNSAEGFVEVKSYVNIGETIRQLRYYQTAARRRMRWTVCAPKTPYQQALEEQGIHFIEYTP